MSIIALSLPNPLQDNLAPTVQNCIESCYNGNTILLPSLQQFQAKLHMAHLKPRLYTMTKHTLALIAKFDASLVYPLHTDVGQKSCLASRQRPLKTAGAWCSRTNKTSIQLHAHPKRACEEQSGRSRARGVPGFV